MIINDKYSFFFFHITKCGGSSLRRMFSDVKGNRNINYYKHCEMRYLESIYKLDMDDFDHSFVVVRNPFERLHSLYYDVIRRFKEMGEAEQRNPVMKEWYLDSYYKAKCKSFSEWLLTEDYTHPKEYYYNDTPFSQTIKSQTWFLTNNKGNIGVKNVFRLEDNDDKILEYINDITNNDYDFDKIPIKNTTDFRPDYRKEYSEEARKHVEKYCKDDLDNFNYDF